MAPLIEGAAAMIVTKDVDEDAIRGMMLQQQRACACRSWMFAKLPGDPAHSGQGLVELV